MNRFEGLEAKKINREEILTVISIAFSISITEISLTSNYIETPSVNHTCFFSDIVVT